jgi:uncharacterized repeat protein (TIGR03803 family)
LLRELVAYDDESKPLSFAAILPACHGMQPLTNKLDEAPQSRTSSGYEALYIFGKPHDGQQPKAGLIDLNGTLYGTTYGGGKSGGGTVFNISTSGTERVLYSFDTFAKLNDGDHPSASLTAVNGVLYGTTEYGGGIANDGTVFKVSIAGKERVLHRFLGYYDRDGANPVASLIYVKGKLYGTTYSGGANQLYGTAFRISTSGKEKVLHSFSPYADGAYPAASLVDVKGTLYGTTENGGVTFSEGGGSVFSISTTGTERVLYGFNYEGSNGNLPAAGLTNIGGLLYGTTAESGAYEGGTIFSITGRGDLSSVHYFGSGSDGNRPVAPLLNVDGILYGTTASGGTFGKGTVFSTSVGGNEAVFHSFSYGSDGATPLAGLIDVDGTLYGTTSAGGTYGDGTVFALTL